ncbi:hypothetical protein FMM55_03995 [Campylobacter sp. LR196d]|uniref:DUF5416 family protein n=1 Tax=Campylobacter sp. LR196d TaxID=2593543 RepID=UPI00123B9AB9|nr:DUF5416 family protein [Campylobacter sp. LR196d]KAA6226720.1 hypothetical protein FMM55_03995 [Campylobacter sp. LR196d]
MKLSFQGLTKEYKIHKSYFCKRAFILEDTIENRDESVFITPLINILEFKDDSFSFNEIYTHLNEEEQENLIIIEEENLQDDFEKNDIEKKETLENSNFKKIKNFKQISKISRFFSNSCFDIYQKKYAQNELLHKKTSDKVHIFEHISFFKFDSLFTKIELLNYDPATDSLSFNLDLFPSGVKYKYAIYENSLLIILLGSISNENLFKFLKSFVYKNKNKASCEKIFTLNINQNPVFVLNLKLVDEPMNFAR